MWPYEQSHIAPVFRDSYAASVIHCLSWSSSIRSLLHWFWRGSTIVMLHYPASSRSSCVVWRRFWMQRDAICVLHYVVHVPSPHCLRGPELILTPEMEPGQIDPTQWILTRWPDLTRSFCVFKAIPGNLDKNSSSLNGVKYRNDVTSRETENAVSISCDFTTGKLPSCCQLVADLLATRRSILTCQDSLQCRWQVRSKLATSLLCRCNGIWETTRHNRHNELLHAPTFYELATGKLV